MNQNPLQKKSAGLLPLLYTLLSVVGFLMFMASELTIDATSEVYCTLMMVFSWVSISIPGLCILCGVLSVKLRRQGKPVLFLPWLPFVVFALNLLFGFGMDWLFLS